MVKILTEYNKARNAIRAIIHQSADSSTIDSVADACFAHPAVVAYRAAATDTLNAASRAALMRQTISAQLRIRIDKTC